MRRFDFCSDYRADTLNYQFCNRISFLWIFQNDTIQVFWQYHKDEPVSVAGILPVEGVIRGSRPLYLVQRDAQPKRNSRNHKAESALQVWTISNQQVSDWRPSVWTWENAQSAVHGARHALSLLRKLVGSVNQTLPRHLVYLSSSSD